MNYYEHHLGDWAKKCGSLSLIEEGAYRRLLDLYYIAEGPLQADLRELFKDARAHKKTEKDAILFVLRRFFVLTDRGYLNDRAEQEIARFQTKSQKAKDSANARWARDAADSAAPDDRSQADATAYANASDETMRTHSEGNAPRARPQSPVTSNHIQRPVVEAVVDVEPKPTAARSAKRCPESFTVGPDLLEWAADKVPAMNAEALRYETEKFRDHTFATARTDWPATWRAWMRKANEDRQKRSGSGANAPEPAWRTERQNRMAQAAPYAVAARPARRPFNPDDEATDVLPLSRPIA